MVDRWVSLLSAIAHFAHLATATLGSQTATNLPVLRWQSTIAASTNASSLRITVFAGARTHWDSGMLYRESPRDPNATTWPVAATTYSGPPLAPSTQYSWTITEWPLPSDNESAAGQHSGTFTTAAALPTLIDEARKVVKSESIRQLWGGQLHNLMARVGSDGYLSTSVYGGYSGLYTRDTSAFILAMVQIGDDVSLASAGAVLRYMLSTFSTPGIKDHTYNVTMTLDRAPCVSQAHKALLQLSHCSRADLLQRASWSDAQALYVGLSSA